MKWSEKLSFIFELEANICKSKYVLSQFMKITYQERIVAFIDVLGFSNIVYSDNTDSLHRYFNFVLTNFKKAAGKHNFDYYLISDSVVVSTKDTQGNLKAMIKVLCILQSQLFSHGILVRGAISYGQLYQNKANNILVGPGLINAYNLEKKAIYPRIILDRRFIKKYFNNTSEAIESLNWLTYKSAGQYHQDFLYLKYTMMFSLFSIYRGGVKNALEFFKNRYLNNDNIEKYEWVRLQFIDALTTSRDYLLTKNVLSRNDKKMLRHTTKALTFFQTL